MADDEGSPGAPAVDAAAMVYPRGTEEFGRVLSFSDGVIAIALTLLVLNLELVPPDDAGDVDVFTQVGELGPQFFAFGLSFALIGFYWVLHHRFVARLAAFDAPMLVWTLLTLAMIVLIPFEADLIGYYGDDEQAIVLYASWFVLFGLLDAAGYLLARRRRLLRDDRGPGEVPFQLAARLAPALVFLVSIPVAYLISTGVAMWSWLAIWPVSVLAGRIFAEPAARPAG